MDVVHRVRFVCSSLTDGLGWVVLGLVNAVLRGSQVYGSGVVFVDFVCLVIIEVSLG
jgi:hypothetical protein